MRERYYTPDEANGLLPELVARIHALRALAAELRLMAAELKERSAEGMDDDETEVRALAFRRKRQEAEEIVESFRLAGVEIKGVEPALLDFPALRLGREVFLCWREGEAQVAFWHGIEAGFNGRTPVSEADSSVWEWVN